MSYDLHTLFPPALPAWLEQASAPACAGFHLRGVALYPTLSYESKTTKYRRLDSNQHEFPRRSLSAVRLPFHHFGAGSSTRIRTWITAINSRSSCQLNDRGSKVAEKGIEPLPCGSEPRILPLDHSAVIDTILSAKSEQPGSSWQPPLFHRGALPLSYTRISQDSQSE